MNAQVPPGPMNAQVPGEATSARARRLRLGALEIDPLPFADALDAIDGLVAAGRGGAVYTANVDHVVLAEDDAAFREAYSAADLALADGMPIVWSSRLLPVRLPERVAGADLLVPLLARAAARRWPVFLLGGAAGVAEEAAARARAMGVEICGTAAPRVDARGPDPEGDAAAEQVRASGARLVLVALGAPKQELWIHRHRRALAPAVAMGVGAALDFLAGRARRAPRIVSRVGLEWAWRLAAEPRRLWTRYLVRDPRFLLVLAREVRRAYDR